MLNGEAWAVPESTINHPKHVVSFHLGLGCFLWNISDKCLVDFQMQITGIMLSLMKRSP
jgi:hypothetical protein